MSSSALLSLDAMGLDSPESHLNKGGYGIAGQYLLPLLSKGLMQVLLIAAISCCSPVLTFLIA